jgi:predicted acyl esterase
MNRDHTRRALSAALLFLAGALASVPVHSDAYEATASFLPEGASFVGFEVKVPMRDGQHLAGDVYLPNAGGKYPVVLIQTPYDKARMRALFGGSLPTGRGAQPPSRGPLFSDTNYAFVVTDWRGRYASSEALNPDVQPGGPEDGFDTVAWVVEQPWCNGKIGTWGPSALGAVQYNTARSHPPNLVCSVPVVMPLNLSYDVYFHGGVLWEEFVKMLGMLGWDFYSQLKAQPVKNEFWQALADETFTRGEEIQVPMLVIGGWYDIYVDSVIEAFETIRSDGGPKARQHSRLIMGPWEHRTGTATAGALSFPNAEHFGNTRAHAFFDHWLRGVDDESVDGGPAITYYQMGANQWRETEVWPPEGVDERAFYLEGSGSLASNAASTGDEFSEFVFDPADPVPTIGGHVLNPNLERGPQDQRLEVESRDDVLLFTTPALKEDLAIAGRPEVRLQVSSDRTDTDFSAVLTDVYPDERSMLVAEGIRRLRFRNSTSKEELATPGEVYKITVELNNTAITFRKGHRVRLIVSSSNHPKYAVNLNDGGAMYREGKGLVATNRVHHSTEHPSALILPVLDR